MGSKEKDIIIGKPLRLYNRNGEFSDYSTEDIVGNRMNRFNGWYCGAGFINLHIGFGGEVTPGSYSCKLGNPDTHLDDKARSYHSLGNVFKEITTLQDWSRCSQDACVCGGDLFIPKFKDLDDISLLSKTANQPSQLDKRVSSIDHPVASERTFNSKYKHQILWDLSPACNYHCAYCGQHEHSMENLLDLETLVAATERLEKKFMKGNPTYFMLGGGEPTVHPGYLHWIASLRNKGHYVSSHTNFSQSSDYYQKLISLCDLNISIHFEFCPQESALSKLEALLDFKFNNLNRTGHIELKLMLIPSLLPQTLAFRDEVRLIKAFQDLNKIGRTTLSIVPLTGYLLKKVSSKYFQAPINEFYKDETCISNYYSEEEISNFGIH